MANLHFTEKRCRIANGEEKPTAPGNGAPVVEAGERIRLQRSHDIQPDDARFASITERYEPPPLDVLRVLIHLRQSSFWHEKGSQISRLRAFSLSAKKVRDF